MISRVFAWLKSPVFPEDEKTRVASNLNALLIIIILAVGLDGVVLYFSAPETIPTLWMNGLVILVCIGMQMLMRGGWVRSAALIMCLFSWGIILYYVCLSGGMSSPGWQFFYPLIAVAALLFEIKGALGFGLLNVIATFLVFIASSQGWLTSVEIPPTLPRLFASHTMGMVMITGVLVIGGRGIRDTLLRARVGEHHLEERNAELSHRDTIMQAVSKTSTQLLRGENWEEEIRDVLRILASADECDRAGIFRIFRDQNSRWRATVRHEWCRPNVSAELNNPLFYNLDVERTGYLPTVERLILKLPAQIVIGVQPDGTYTPSIAGDTKATVHLAIAVRGELWGSLFFSMTRSVRIWPESSLTALQIAADMLGAVIERKEAEDALLEYANVLEDRVKARTTELQIANEELRHLNQVKDEFVSNVSHELRTPITSLKIRHHMLEKQPERLSTHLAVLKRETDRLAGIINDLLTLSRMDQGRVTLQRDAVNLTTLVSQLVSDRIPLAHERGLHMFAETPQRAVWVKGDGGLLEQALSVLITNAINYTPSDGRIVVRIVQAAGDSSTTSVEVQDNGLGIAKEEQSHLFSRFFRGSSGQSSGVAGTGLGLAIAREIVTRHDGQISVESDGIAGHGTTFTIVLPTLAPTAAPIVAQVESPSGS